jgi:two-component system chemotaxis sensor kinase CheA
VDGNETTTATTPSSVEVGRIDPEPKAKTESKKENPADSASLLTSPKKVSPTSNPTENQTKSSPQATSIRMDTRVLDELLELIGEVVLGRNQFQHQYAQDKSFKSLSQSITKLHQHVIRTRMQPIGTLFEKYQRIVRDLGQKLGKKVLLHIEGADIELDRTILEALADPMTHLIRNALDHGIEIPTERSAGGKPVVANLQLKAIHESGQILLQVQDDGRGIDAGRLRSKALEKGLITAEEAGTLDEKASLDLIYHPGFSTKEATNEISGRGVGMDVVRTNLERIGCQLEIQTQVGKGTTFSARIPLTQAIVNSSVISGLVVEVGPYSLALPQVAINEIVRLSSSEASERIQGVVGQEVLRLRDRIIPLVHLDTLLEIDRDPARSEHSTTDDSSLRNRSNSLLLIILQYKHSYFGVRVDRVLGTEEIVVKRIPTLLKARHLFAGTTVLGNAKVALILDINGMVAKASLQEGFEEGEAFLRHGSQRSEAGRQRIVVFENAPGEYFGIPVNLLSEVDRFRKEEIGTLGKKQFIRRHGETLPLLRLEEILPVTPLAPDLRDKGIVLVPSRVTFPAGICGRRIVTTLDMGEDLNTRDSDEKGVLGSFFHEGLLINLLDIYSLLHRSDPQKYKDIIPPEVSHCRVLLAEDQVFFRQLITHYFRSFGIKDLTVVENGREAVDLIYKNPGRFDVIVSDIEMPVMDGYQLVSTLKADPRLKSLPVMALTTLSSESQIRRGMDEGFDAYEIKIDKEKVIRRLAALYQVVREGKESPQIQETNS